MASRPRKRKREAQPPVPAVAAQTTAPETRNVSRLELDSVLSPDNSQNRWLNSCAVSLVLINFSIRSVARPLKGALLLTVGDVE